jgi:hypothetical protein
MGSVTTPFGFERRARFAIGLFLGAFGGVLVAPTIQRDLRAFGVDQYSVLPMVPVIVLISLGCGYLLARRT